MKFLHYKERENVLKAYRDKRKNIMNQPPDNPTSKEDVWKTIRISDDFPEPVIRVRFKLYSFLKSSIEEERHLWTNG